MEDAIALKDLFDLIKNKIVFKSLNIALNLEEIFVVYVRIHINYHMI